MSELKPCPFCGGKDVFVEQIIKMEPDCFAVGCKGCGVAYLDWPDKKQAIDAWNKRHEIDGRCWSLCDDCEKSREKETIDRVIEILKTFLKSTTEGNGYSTGFDVAMLIDEIKKEFLNNSTKHNHELCSTEKSKTETSD